MLLFKAKFRNALLDGSKTTALRAWKSNRVKAGTVAKTNLGISLAIISVESIQLAEITDAHAKADGFLDRESLMVELQSIYDALPDKLTLVQFRLAIPSPLPQ